MKLCELNIFELEWELDVIRGLPCDGDLDELVIRLREAMENEGLDPEIHEFDEMKPVKRMAPVSGRNVGASSGNFDMTQLMAVLNQMNQKMDEIIQFNQEIMREIEQPDQVKKQEMMEVIKQEEVKQGDIEVDQRIQDSEEKLLDTELDGASAQVIRMEDTVELRTPTFNGTSSFGVLGLQLEAATWRHDRSMAPEYTERTGMNAFTDGVGDPDIRGGVLLSPGVMFVEAVVHALTGEAALEIVKPAVRIRRAELEQPNSCGAVGKIWPRGNWPRNNWPLTKVQNGHGRMKYWIYGRTGHILRNGWKRTRKKVRKKVRAPSPLWRISKVDRRRVVERKEPRKSDLLKMDALMGRPGQVDVGHHGRMEEKESIIDVGRMQISQAGEWIGDRIRRQHLEDPDLSMMVKLRENDHRPAWGEIADGGPALKGYWSQWDSLTIDKGCLVRKWESFDGESKQSVAEWCRGCEGCTAAKGPGNGGLELVQMTNGEATIGRMAVDHRTRARCDVRANDGEFENGQFAWLHSRQRTMAFSERLRLEWRDPYRVIDGMEDVICRERDERCVLGELHGGSRVIHLERPVLYTGGGLDPVRDEQVWAEGSVTN